MKEQDSHSHSQLHKLSALGVLVTLGIVYGDIGTSPLYVYTAIIDESPISKDLALGGLSCIIWTLTLMTTLKYVVFTLRADNNGEGGIFSLFALVRRHRKWLIVPAIIGGAALLADGIITPPISIASAVEGLKGNNPELNTLPYIYGILVGLFVIQQFGTKKVGGSFGPIMFIWFTMLSVLGLTWVITNPGVFAALNPYYAYRFLTQTEEGYWLLGAVFLCTTGGEALYSDLGHCGRSNIRVSWMFVKTSLILNYAGQCAWLLAHEGQTLDGRRPFFELMPEWWLMPGIIIATAAAIIASQALITGSFTLISEAMRLDLWPKSRIHYPSDSKGQLYIPSINFLLMAGCLAVVYIFEESTNMEAAYGLSITLTMLMTTILFTVYIMTRRKYRVWGVVFLLVYLAIELSFLGANLRKFMEGGYVTLMIGGVLVLIMYVWFKARKIKNRYTEFVNMDEYKDVLMSLSNDFAVPKYCTHLVYMTSSNSPHLIEQKTIYSILRKQPKRADLYWFLHVSVADKPYNLEYKVDMVLPGEVIYVDFRLGFRQEPRVNALFRKVVEDLVKSGEVDITSRYDSLSKNNIVGDFRFVVLQKFLSAESSLHWFDRIVMQIHFLLKQISLSEERAFGLDSSNVTIEKYPLILSPSGEEKFLKRVY